MKNLIYVFFIVVILSLAACEKEEPDLRTECQKNNIGYVTFRNQSTHAFDIWIDNEYYRQQPGNTYINKVSFQAGYSYKIYVKQVAGYVFYPTEKTFNITVNMCDEKEISYTD